MVSVLYKLYATILLNRLKGGGAESRLWNRQFGFRSGRSTEDALFIARRRIEQALAARGGSAFLLALDWRKAFDSIAPDRMLSALKRYGVNDEMLTAIAEIYSSRRFEVVDDGHVSEERPQRAGISQGCPLSPFLFGMVMTVLMADASASLGAEAARAFANGDLEDVLFADDTLLISKRSKDLEEYMTAVERHGLDYGLQIHWGKVHLIAVNPRSSVQMPSGATLATEPSMLYLGSTVHSDGKFGCEVSRKLGMASAEFKVLHRLWRNSSLSVSRKIRLFDALVVSKLTYAVASAWLSRSDLRRMDGFHVSCLRRILRIPPSFISRISNEKVRKTALRPPISASIRSSQLRLFEQVLMCPGKKELKQATFWRDTTTPSTDAYVRKVGRPRDNWTDQMIKIRREQ